MPDDWPDAYGLLWYLHEREYGTHSRAVDREKRRQEARTLEKYKRSVAAIKARDGITE